LAHEIPHPIARCTSRGGDGEERNDYDGTESLSHTPSLFSQAFRCRPDATAPPSPPARRSREIPTPMKAPTLHGDERRYDRNNVSHGVDAPRSLVTCGHDGDHARSYGRPGRLPSASRPAWDARGWSLRGPRPEEQPPPPTPLRR